MRCRVGRRLGSATVAALSTGLCCLVAAGCVAGVDGGSGDATGSPTLPVTLRVEAPRSATDAPLELRVTTLNPGPGSAALLSWNTPFEATLSADAFDVTRDGEPVAYRGRMVKRAPPPPEGAVSRLGPGDALERTIDLTSAYAMDVPGTYTVRFRDLRLPIDDPEGTSGPLARLVAGEEGPVTVERFLPGTD